MIAAERTRQRLDPIGTFGTSLSTVFFTAGAFLTSAWMFVRSIDILRDPALAVLALLFLGIGCTVLMLASNPIRAPFTRRSMGIVVTAGVAASAFELASVWGDGAFIRNGWGPLALGLMMLAMGPYRPARELVAAGSFASIFVGFMVVLRGGSLGHEFPDLAVVAVTVLPILALTYAAAAHSNTLILALERWQRKMQRPGRVVSRDDEDGIARSVQQDRVTILNRAVLPFFLEMIEKPAVSNADRERARDIAASFRRVMVEEVDRSWLEHALEQLSRGAPGTPTVRDDDHVAVLMTYDQRTAVRAFLAALYSVEARDPDFITIELFRDGSLCRFAMVAELEIADFALRSRFSPYFAVLRVVFPDLRLEYRAGVLTLSFSYEQR